MIEVALVGASAITAMIAFVLACVQEFDAGYRDAQLQAAKGGAGESTRATGSVGGDNAVAAVLIAVNAVAVAFEFVAFGGVPQSSVDWGIPPKRYAPIIWQKETLFSWCRLG